MKNRSAFLAYLNSIANSDEDTLAKYVANEALDRDYSVENWFEDLLQYGCVSGMVSGLVYYCDTEMFFDKYYHEIMELKEEYEESIGQPMQIPYQLKNHLAWFGFEETARKILLDFGD